MVIKVPDIRIELIDYTTWVPIQGNLKDLYTDNFNKLKKSLQKKGGFVPAFIWLDNGIPKILDAHQRHRLFEAENVVFEHPDGTKDKRYPCAIIEAENLKDAKERLLVISSQYGRMTQEGHDEFTFDVDADFITETTNFDALINFGAEDEEPEELEAKEDKYEEPDNMAVDVVLGDLIEIGPHKLLCGDSTDSEQVARLMDGEKADMVFTDPPYGISHSGKGIVGDSGANDFGEILGDDDILAANDSFNLIYSLYPEALHIWWGANYYSQTVPNGFGWLVWDKQREGNTFSGAELAFVNKGVRLDVFRHLWHGMIKGSEMGQKRLHPTQKPVALIEWCFKNYEAGDLITDPFLGSGTTMVAAHQLNRRCYGMELDPKYCQVIIDRMQKLDDTLEVRINGKPYEKKQEVTV